MTSPHARASAQALPLADACRRLGYKSRTHIYRLVDPHSPWFDPELFAIVRKRPSGARYVLEDELDALLRSRCSTAAPEGTAAA